MNPQTAPATLFLILFGMVIALFVLVQLLFRRLEYAHPRKYESLGRPSLFRRGRILGYFATLKFLATREHKTLQDTYLSKLSDAMLVLFAIYVILFFGLFFLVAGQTPAA